MDGTLLRNDLNDVFWNVLIPRLYAEQRNMPLDEATKFVLREYDKVGSGDARWYIPEYWFERLGLAQEASDVLAMVGYDKGVYDDIHMLADFSKKYKIVVSTNNARSMLEHKLCTLKDARQFISDTFSSVSDFDRIVKNKDFYVGICRKMDIRPGEMLHIGDDPDHDLAVPRSAGVNALLIDRERKVQDGNVIHSLADLRRVLGI